MSLIDKSHCLYPSRTLITSSNTYISSLNITNAIIPHLKDTAFIYTRTILCYT